MQDDIQKEVENKKQVANASLNPANSDTYFHESPIRGIRSVALINLSLVSCPQNTPT